MQKIYSVEDYLRILKKQIKYHQHIMDFINTKLHFKPKSMTHFELDQLSQLRNLCKTLSSYTPTNLVTLNTNTYTYEVSKGSKVLYKGSIDKNIVDMS